MQTGVKDKAFPATRYVTDLVARDTVNTMPETTLDAVASGASGYLFGKLPVGLGLALFGFRLGAVLLRSIPQSFLELIVNRLVGDVIGAVGLLLKVFFGHVGPILGDHHRSQGPLASARR